MPLASWVDTFSEEWISQPSTSSPMGAAGTMASDYLSATSTTASRARPGTSTASSSGTTTGTTAVRKGAGGERNEEWKRHVLEQHQKDLFSPLTLESLFQPPNTVGTTTTSTTSTTSTATTTDNMASDMPATTTLAMQNSTQNQEQQQNQDASSKQQQRKTFLPVPMPTLQEERSDGLTPRRHSPRRHVPFLMRAGSEPTENPEKKAQPTALVRSGSEPLDAAEHHKPRPALRFLRRSQNSPVGEISADQKAKRRSAMFASEIEPDHQSNMRYPEPESNMVAKPRPRVLQPSGRWSSIGSEVIRRNELISPVSESLWKDDDQDRNPTPSRMNEGLEVGHILDNFPDSTDGRKYYRDQGSAVCQSSPPMMHQYRASDHPDFDDTYPEEPTKASYHSNYDSPGRLPTPDRSPDTHHKPSIAPGNSYFQNAIRRRVGARASPRLQLLPDDTRSSDDREPFSTPHRQMSDMHSQTPPSASRSPMKLFTCDTYTSSKLEQRLEQMERSMHPHPDHYDDDDEESEDEGEDEDDHDDHDDQEYDDDSYDDSSSFSRSSRSERSFSGGSSVVNHLEKLVRTTERRGTPPQRAGRKRAQKDLTLTEDLTPLFDSRRSSAPTRSDSRRDSSTARKHRRWHSNESTPENDGISGPRSPLRDRTPKRVRRSIGGADDKSSVRRRRVTDARTPRRRRGLTIEEGSILANSERRSRTCSREIQPSPKPEESLAVVEKRGESTTPTPRKKKRPIIKDAVMGMKAIGSPRNSPASPVTQGFGAAGFMTFSGKGDGMQGLVDFEMPDDDGLRKTSFNTESWLQQAEDVMESIRKRSAYDGGFFEMDAAGHSFRKGMEVLKQNSNLLTITDTVGNRPRGSSFLERRPPLLPPPPGDDQDLLDHQTRGLGSSVQSRSAVEVITNEPEILNHHLARKNNSGMVFDEGARAWVSLSAEKEPEEDPFHGISDLSVDSKEEERALDIARKQWNACGSSTVERSHLWRSSQFLDEHERRLGSSVGSTRTTVTDLLSEFAASKTETRATSYGTDSTRGKEDLENAAAALEEDTREGNSEPANDEAVTRSPLQLPDMSPQFADVYTSSPIKTEDIDGFLEHGSLRRPGQENSSGNILLANLRSNQRRRSGRAFMGRPIPKIAEEDETHGNPAPRPIHPDVLRELQQINLSSSLTPLPTPFKSQVSFQAPPSTGRKHQVSFHLTSLPNISYQFDATEALITLERSYISSRRGPKATSKAIEASFSIAQAAIVKHLTDIAPFDEHWEVFKSLDITNRNLETLFFLDEYCPQLRSLDASNNELGQLAGVPQSVFELKLVRNNLSDATHFGHLVNLEFLDVSGNGLESLAALKSCSHLREIRADDNRLTGIDGIWEMEGLVKLRARRNRIETVDFKGSQFNHLTDLDLRGNRIHSISNLHLLPKLLNLNLDDNLLTTLFPVSSSLSDSESQFPCLSSLRTLKLTNNSFSSLDLTPFPSLRILYIDNNPISSISSAHRAPNLDAVSIRSSTCNQPWTKTQITNLLRGLADVRKLYLSGNEINVIPSRGLPRFLNLQYLELAATGLSTLPTGSGFAKTFPNLRVLNVNYNAISSEDLETIMMCKRILQIEAVGTAVDRLPDFGQNGKRPDSPRAEWPRELKYLDLRNTPLTNGFYPPEASSSLETKPGNIIIGAAGKTESPPPPGQTSNGPSASADADKDRYPKDPFSLKEWKEDETWRRKLPREVRERREEYEDLVKRWSRGRVKVLDGRRGW